LQTNTPAPLKGWLKKQGEDMFKGWKLRYFYQVEDKLYYYKTESTDKETASGYIDLSQINAIERDKKDPTLFSLSTPKRVYLLKGKIEIVLIKLTLHRRKQCRILG
jgi:hypothetical protein